MHAREWVLVHGTHRRRLNATTLRKVLGRQKGRCTWCDGPVGRYRSKWCGDQCVEEFRRTCDPAWTLYRIKLWLARGRWQVLRCEGCGLDVMARMNALAWLDRRARTAEYGRGFGGAGWKTNNLSRRKLRRSDQYRAISLRRRIYQTHLADAWELDHTTPVSEGGGCCGPEGLRVLCLECHKQVTRELKARLARRKKET